MGRKLLIVSKTKTALGSSIEARPHLSLGLSLQLFANMRSVWCAVVTAAWIISNLMPARAEVEEMAVNGTFAPKYAGLSIYEDFIINLLANNDDSIGNRLYNDTEIREYVQNNQNATTRRRDNSGVSDNPNSLRDTHIPDAVWTFDASSGAHLDISSEPGSEFDTAPERAQKNADFWTKASISLSADNNTTNSQGSSVILPIAIQVASCGGSSAEHSNLEYCNISDNASSQPSNNYIKSENSNANSIPTTPGVSPVSTSNTSSEETQDTAQTPAILNNIAPESNVIDLSEFSDLCLATSASCPITQTAPTDSPPAPTDSPPAPPDSPPAPTDFPSAPLTPPTPVISVGDPGPIPQLPITPTPPLGASAVPETSTWIMMMVGFAIMIVACRRRGPNPIKRGAGGPFHRSPNGQ